MTNRLQNTGSYGNGYFSQAVAAYAARMKPEDINRIMRAIARDAKLRKVKMQIEDETSGEKVLDEPEEERKEDESVRQTEQSDF